MEWVSADYETHATSTRDGQRFDNLFSMGGRGVWTFKLHSLRASSQKLGSG